MYAGKVDHGFDKASAADLQKRLKPLIRETQPYAKRVGHKGIWVEPKLLAEIEYRAISAEGKVRHPLLQRLAGGFVIGRRLAARPGSPLHCPRPQMPRLATATLNLNATSRSTWPQSSFARKRPYPDGSP
ncbi:hypothetical protein QCM77_37325 [Bradyrhizobium sp. SSUT18]|uniref:ATP dependent DNA ligase n=1 Tax=unclassified Bradyrhizobium TaxID=2631580 RepID=UPI0024494B56|nr:MULTISPECIES: hypothetical protein [unclassified Bradyrhizobium]MDH2347053.1 hypothetical protein [Bradyrhizobium sp. SSUT77]MDH2356313.1 hypothetical protein [Bradyrhizobium sp. SSUT112]MDH2405513.1 hypothetical protein [Bradyrhizobium sp. SSUT18]